MMKFLPRVLTSCQLLGSLRNHLKWSKSATADGLGALIVFKLSKRTSFLVMLQSVTALDGSQDTINCLIPSYFEQ